MRPIVVALHLILPVTCSYAKHCERGAWRIWRVLNHPLRQGEERKAAGGLFFSQLYTYAAMPTRMTT